jgi:pyruvate formate lyase activating enzyme
MEDGSFLFHLSVLNRNVQKYYDRALAKYGIGYGQLMFLLAINENEGITMQEASKLGEVDKGTTTKSIQRLIEQDYVQQRQDETDRRIKRLYTTAKAGTIMNDLYELRNTCRQDLSREVDLDTFEDLLAKVSENSRTYLEPESAYSGLRIGGLQKVTLLDYPGKVACTVFLGGCDLKCPFCHNRELVFLPENYDFMDPEEILSYLDKRRGILDGVCISGGEPLLQEGLAPFIRAIRQKGFLIKLDTNGTYPDRLEYLLSQGLLDYVAMDLKNVPAKYALTTGINEENFELSKIQRSIDLLMKGTIEYEFRTTVVREFHDGDDLEAMAEWIQGAKHYALQQYQDSGNVIAPGLHAYSKAEMEEFLPRVQKYIPAAELRGVKED